MKHLWQLLWELVASGQNTKIIKLHSLEYKGGGEAGERNNSDSIFLDFLV